MSAAGSSPDGSPGGRPLPLEGITVLELGHIYQGPYAGFLLAMAGARVIKVEPPTGESLRARGPNLGVAMLNSCKESVVIDMKADGGGGDGAGGESGLDLFRRLVAEVDVIVMNYAPGVPEKLGIDFESLRDVNPRLIHAQGSGFGVRNADGSVVETEIPAMDITIQAHSGGMSITGRDGDPPMKSGAAYVDFLGGTHLYGAVVTALFERERTGLGRSVEATMIDAAYFTLTTALIPWHHAGEPPPRRGNRHIGGRLAPYNTFRCADGHIAIIGVAERHWTATLGVVGREDLLDDERFNKPGRRARNVDEADAVVEDWSASRPKAEVAAALQAARVPAAEVMTLDEITNDPLMIERGALVWTDHPELGRIPLPHSPIRWHDSPLRTLDPSPALGADNERVFGDLLGLPSDELAELADLITPRPLR